MAKHTCWKFKLLTAAAVALAVFSGMGAFMPRASHAASFEIDIDFDIAGLIKDIIMDKVMDKIGDFKESIFGPSKGGANLDEGRFIFDFNTFATLIAIITYASGELEVENDRYDTYKANYLADHKPLNGRQYLDRAAGQFDASGLSAEMTGGGAVSYGASVGSKAPGYRGRGANIYSDIYRTRRDTWKKDIEGALKGNLNQARVLSDNAEKLIEDLHSVSLGAGEEGKGGYMEVLQAGALTASYQGVGFLQMRSDMIRQTDLNVREMLEEAQDDFDETSAFEMAVNSWKSTVAGTGY
ncbi:MAG: hypothetical protein FWG71_02475 [Synergistaceae bacterium]|nr:hypothetical protein [Synergistaceae bacterium]